MTARRWYASRAAAGRRPDKYAVRLFPAGLMLFWTLDPVVGAALVAEVRVNGRSDAHVDRLARDWLGHGVTPTKSGGRGVRSPWRRVRGPRSHPPYYVSDALIPNDAVERFDRNERRAARVVSR